MNKRGQAEVLQLDLLFRIIAGLLIASVLITAAFQLNNTPEYNKYHVEKDIKLLLDTLEFLPIDIKVNYPVGKENYAVIIKDGDIKVEGTTKITDLIKKENYIIFEKEGDCIKYQGECV